MPKNRFPAVAISAIAVTFSSAALAQTIPLATEAAIATAVEVTPAPPTDAAPPADAAPAPAPAAVAPAPAPQPAPAPMTPPAVASPAPLATGPAPFQPASYVTPAWHPAQLVAPLPGQASAATPRPAANTPDHGATDDDADGDRYQGIFVKVDFGSQFATSGNAGVGAQQGCSSCEAGMGVGGELGLRIGYSFGWVALEVHGFGGYDNSGGAIGSSTDGPPAGDYTFHRIGGGGAIGARLTYPHPTVRPTVGFGVGVARRAMTFVYEGAPLSATSTAPPADVGDFVGYTAPRLEADAGVMLGSTPGVKIAIGVQASVEMAGEHASSGQVGSAVDRETGAPSAAGNVMLTRGAQVMIGPALSLQFGQ